jgi:hypothetical protein
MSMELLISLVRDDELRDALEDEDRLFLLVEGEDSWSTGTDWKPTIEALFGEANPGHLGGTPLTDDLGFTPRMALDSDETDALHAREGGALSQVEQLEASEGRRDRTWATLGEKKCRDGCMGSRARRANPVHRVCIAAVRLNPQRTQQAGRLGPRDPEAPRRGSRFPGPSRRRRPRGERRRAPRS